MHYVFCFIFFYTLSISCYLFQLFQYFSENLGNFYILQKNEIQKIISDLSLRTI